MYGHIHVVFQGGALCAYKNAPTNKSGMSRMHGQLEERQQHLSWIEVRGACAGRKVDPGRARGPASFVVAEGW